MQEFEIQAAEGGPLQGDWDHPWKIFKIAVLGSGISGAAF